MESILKIKKDKKEVIKEGLIVYGENKSFFTIRHTNIIKGIAILAMLFHHLGLDSKLSIFKDSVLFTNIAAECKVCVSIFLILSGYGLCISAKKEKVKSAKEQIIFSLKHLLKLMINFWIVFGIFVIWGVASGRRPLTVYGDNIVKNMTIDFLGMAHYFSSPTYNITWWFMSLIIILYAIFPLLRWILKKSPIIFYILICYIRLFAPLKFYMTLNVYLIVFGLGMICAEFSLFDRIKELKKSRIEEIILSIAFLIFGIFSRYKIGGIFDVVAAFSIIFACNSIFANIRLIDKVLELLGKHSSNMFMLHTFIYKYFYSEFIAKLKYWMLMYIVLIVSTLIISIIIEFFKKYIKKEIIEYKKV